MQAAQREIYIHRHRSEIGRACGNVGDHDYFSRKLFGPHLECVPVARCGKDLREIVMAHLPPWPDKIDYHRAIAVDRDEKVAGAGLRGALRP